MLFESTNANIIFVLSAFSLILWSGPSRFLPGYTDTLPHAATRQGTVRGERWLSRDGRYFSVFRSVPYAKQPVGARRFKVPEPLDAEDAWEGARDSTRQLPHCHQTDPFTGLRVGREDCLMLNVYTPDLEADTKLPVMVYIHGGGFVTGSGSSILQGPSFIMDQDVVLVTINYRLGVFGFLSLETEEAPGNLGLWDQRQALVWVRHNIASFGGDPGRVTIFGMSAGSMSVHFHLVSPRSRGLFHAAIMQSGTATSPYTRINRRPREYGAQLAAALGCGDSDNILACLQAAPANAVHDQLFMFDECSIRRDMVLTFPGPWVPVVDSFLDSPFLPAEPEVLQRQNVTAARVPVMLGFTSEDGLLFTSRLVADPQFNARFRDDWATCGPLNLLGLEAAAITAEDAARVDTLMERYTGAAQPPASGTSAQLTALFTDAVFGLTTHNVARALVEGGNTQVYKYYFSYSGTSSLCDLLLLPYWQTPLYFLSRLPGLSSLFPSLKPGCCHADDLLYLFQMTPITDLIPGAEDQAISRAMVAMWTQFATSHAPHPAWSPAHTAGDLDYFVIDKEMGMERVAELERFRHWDT